MNPEGKKNMSLSLERLDQGNMKIITLTIITANIYCLGTMWQALYCLPFRSNLFTLHHKTLRSALLLWTFALEQQASGGQEIYPEPRSQEAGDPQVQKRGVGWGWDELGDWDQHIYTIDAMYKIDN